MDTKVCIRFVRSDEREFLIDGTDWKIPSKGLDGFGSYENDITTVDNAVGDGGIIVSDRIAPKDRTVTAISRNPYLNDVLRKSAISFFNPKFDYKMYITYMGITRWVKGKIYKFSIPAQNVNRVMEMNITLLSPNPFFKSYDNFGKNIASVVGMCGFPYLCSITSGTPKGITGGKFNFAKKVLLDNDGDVDTYCKAVISANGDVVNPKIIINDNYVMVLDNMKANDVIIIDFTQNPPTVKKNGVNFIGHCDRTSAFDDMQLPVGSSEVSFDADTGSNLMNVSIYYNKLYGAI